MTTPTADGQGWRPIAEAPMDETEILGYYPDTGSIYVVFMDPDTERWWHQGYEGSLRKPPSHWMPLPPPPTSGEAG